MLYKDYFQVLRLFRQSTIRWEESVIINFWNHVVNLGLKHTHYYPPLRNISDCYQSFSEFIMSFRPLDFHLVLQLYLSKPPCSQKSAHLGCCSSTCSSARDTGREWGEGKTEGGDVRKKEKNENLDYHFLCLFSLLFPSQNVNFSLIWPASIIHRVWVELEKSYSDYRKLSTKRWALIRGLKWPEGWENWCATEFFPCSLSHYKFHCNPV